MAIFTNEFLTFDAKGIKEQVANVIFNISPQDTPFTSMAGKRRVKGTLDEWQTDSLASVNTANKALQGDDSPSMQALTPTARVGNYTQISTKTFGISRTLEQVDKYGRDSEIAYQKAKKGAELKRDLEAIILQANQGGTAGDSTTAPTTATLHAWLKTNVDDGGGAAADPAYTSGVPSTGRTDGTQRAFTETILKTVLQTMWSNGARVEGAKVFLGPVNKVVFSGFSGIATKSIDVAKRSEATTVAAADVYVSNFGTVVAMPTRFQRERDGWVLDFQWIDIGFLEPFSFEELSKTGDGKKYLGVVEWMLRVKQEAGLGLCADLNT